MNERRMWKYTVTENYRHAKNKCENQHFRS